MSQNNILAMVQKHYNEISKAHIIFDQCNIYQVLKLSLFFSFLGVADNSTKGNYDGQLIPTALDNLSPQDSAIFLFGCQVMQLLENCPMFPSALLLLAKSIPFAPSSSNGGLLSHCSRDFYFDATNQILYLSEAKLQHVGHFISVILQSMAHIASGNQRKTNRRQFWRTVSCPRLATVI